MVITATQHSNRRFFGKSLKNFFEVLKGCSVLRTQGTKFKTQEEHPTCHSSRQSVFCSVNDVTSKLKNHN